MVKKVKMYYCDRCRTHFGKPSFKYSEQRYSTEKIKLREVKKINSKCINCSRLKDLNTNLEKDVKESDVLYQQFTESTSSDLVKKVK
jgi:hypothetical protein